MGPDDVSQPLSKSAARVQEALLAAGLEARVVELPDSTRSAQEAAAAIGCAVEQIAKSIAFQRLDDGSLVLAVLPGVDRVDTAALAALLGTEVRRADPELVRTVTGFAIGGVPPLGHETAILTILDPALLTYDTVWAAAGTPNSVFAVRPRDLVAAVRMEIAAIAEKPA
jgi:prolyl-tRNA editing enzyme YbaK/EbsC (Cys-tRNA(Pro) deacylase)